MKPKPLIIIFLIISSGIIFYLAAEPDLTKETIFVSRVLDGDTFEAGNGDVVRLVGINGPERGMAYWDEAKMFLEGMVLNRSVEFESKERDKYGRWLGYVFVGGEMVNEAVLGNGMGHLYVYEKDGWYDELADAEKFARENELGIWKRSENFDCVDLVELKYEEGKRCNNEEVLILENNCGVEIEVLIKDEATHIYHEILSVSRNEFEFSCIWNDDGDSVFVWDDSGLLLFWRY